MLKEHNTLVDLIAEFKASAGNGILTDALANRLAHSIKFAKAEIDEYGGEAHNSYNDALSLCDMEAVEYDVFIAPYLKAISEAEALLASHR